MSETNKIRYVSMLIIIWIAMINSNCKNQDLKNIPAAKNFFVTKWNEISNMPNGPTKSYIANGKYYFGSGSKECEIITMPTRISYTFKSDDDKSFDYEKYYDFVKFKDTPLLLLYSKNMYLENILSPKGNLDSIILTTNFQRPIIKIDKYMCGQTIDTSQTIYKSELNVIGFKQRVDVSLKTNVHMQFKLVERGGEHYIQEISKEHISDMDFKVIMEQYSKLLGAPKFKDYGEPSYNIKCQYYTWDTLGYNIRFQHCLYTGDNELKRHEIEIINWILYIEDTQQMKIITSYFKELKGEEGY